MSGDLSSMSVEDAAVRAAGSWRERESFAWHAEPEDGDAWCIVDVAHRDSDCLAQSNAAAMRAALEPWASDHGVGWPNYHGPQGDDGSPDVSFERASHWGFGWVEAICVRCVGADGEPTPAFCELHSLLCRLSEYPVLDESDFSEREWSAGTEWANQAGPNVFGRAWGVFIDAGDVMRVAFDIGASLTGDGWGRVWEEAGDRMGVRFDDGGERWAG